jgi:hypothetical protein
MLKSANFAAATFFTLSLSFSIYVCTTVFNVPNLMINDLDNADDDYDFTSNFNAVPHHSKVTHTQDEIITNIPHEITSNSKLNFNNQVFIIPRI